MRALPLLLLILLALPARGAAQHPFTTSGSYEPAIPPPHTVLGYELGEHFTPHHLLMRYLDRLAASSRVRIDTVAHSFEGREVVMAVVTSEENHGRLERIRERAGRLADPRGASEADIVAAARDLPAIVWLGFTVHGPEASGAEAAIALLYQLAAGTDSSTRMLLDSLVILIDPLQNPDGHERHAQDVRRMRSALGVPVHPQARIHAGTWPGPRTSHYHFDLNRDWYTQSHPETRGRVAAMLRWWPHVAVDLHEMSSNATYFFPPAMDPVNRLVPPSILRWWHVFAAGNIAAFDAAGWSFFRREGYDEFYPGYGSSWPLYTGAIGMTYEQASSRGGAIRRTDGDVLTLRQAATRHYGAAWATLETAARHASGLVRDYAAFRRRAIADAARGGIRAVVLERDDQGRAEEVVRLLARNGIEVRRLRQAATVRDAVAYGETRRAPARFAAGSFVVDYAQPQGLLARAILEPDAPLDSAFIAEELERRRTGQRARFYDLTAWSLPFAHGVRAWSLPSVIGPLEEPALPDDPPAAPARAAYGYAFPPGSAASHRLLGALLADSIRVWYAPRAFRVGADDFPRGGFVVRVPAEDSTIHDRIARYAAASGARVAALASGAAEAGTDLGSSSVVIVRPPRIALVSGPPIAGQSFGYAWYALDQRLGYPHTAIDVSSLGGALADFDVLIIPSTSASGFHRALGDDGVERLRGWVRGGGTLITLDGATAWLASERSGLSRFRLANPDTTDREGAPLPAGVPGAIVRATADTLSPLMAGVRSAEMPVLAFSDRVYRSPGDLRPGEVVVRHAPADRLRLAGYLWPEVPARLGGTPYLWTERVGGGRIIAFAGDPNFRDSWHALLPLFANAIFLGPGM